MHAVPPASDLNNPADAEFRLDRVFGHTRAPWNVRVTARLRRLPLLRALGWWNVGCDWLACSGLLRFRGKFTYRRGSESREIPFDGRNGQFEAIHDPLYRNGYEPETSLLLARLNHGPSVFYDIGANWGYFSLLVAAAPGFTGKIHAFEPNTVSRADLIATIAAAGLGDMVTPHALALTDFTGESHLRAGASFRTGLAGLSTAGDGTRITVKRLDDLELPPPTCLKIDVEGAEAAVLRGAARVLRTARPFVVIENFLNRDAHEGTLEPLLLLEAAGYRLFVPALALRWQGTDLLTSYWTHIPTLLAEQQAAPIHLMPLHARERFLFSHHLNLLACPEERVAALTSHPKIKLARNS
jgi:FkbM family methyltransferase